MTLHLAYSSLHDVFIPLSLHYTTLHYTTQPILFYLFRCNDGIEKSCMPCEDEKRRRPKIHVEDRESRRPVYYSFFFCFCSPGCHGPWSLSWIPFQVLGKA